MASTINSDNGVVSGTSGLKSTADTSGVLALQSNGSTGVTLDTSLNVGVGTTSPSYKLDVNGVIATGSGSNRGFFYNDGSKILLESSSTYPIAVSVNGAVRATFDSAGNLGLGVTPSTWATFTGLQVGALGGVNIGGATGDNFYAMNAYYNAGWKYAATGYTALMYRMVNGEHRWSNAASGTAGNAISFTQAMTLDSSGQLAIGDTSAGGYTLMLGNGSGNRGRLYIKGATGGNYPEINIDDSMNTSGRRWQIYSTSGSLVFGDTTGGERFRYGTSGQLGIGGANYGTSGQVLTSGGSGAAPTWATPSGGSWVYLSTVTASGAATADVETTFNSTYDMYAIVITGLTPSTVTDGWYARLKVGGSYQTANYSANQLYMVSNSPGVGARQSASLGYIQFGYAGELDSFSSFVVYVPNPSSTSVYKSIYWTGFSQRTTLMNTFMGSGMYTGSTSALTGVRFYPAGGNLTGTFRLYGIKNS